MLETRTWCNDCRVLIGLVSMKYEPSYRVYRLCCLDYCYGCPAALAVLPISWLGVEYVIINAITEKTKTRLFDLELPVASTKFSRGTHRAFQAFLFPINFNKLHGNWLVDNPCILLWGGKNHRCFNTGAAGDQAYVLSFSLSSATSYVHSQYEKMY